LSPLGCLAPFQLEQLDGLPLLSQCAADICPVHSRLLVAAHIPELFDILHPSTEGCQHIYGMILLELTDITMLIMTTS